MGRGTILVNDFQSPVTNAGVDGVDGFSIDISAMNLPAGTVVRSATTSPGGAPYDIDFRFYAADGTHVEPPKVNGGDPCETLAIGEQSCAIPDGITTIRVSGKAGVALDVSVFVG